MNNFWQRATTGFFFVLIVSGAILWRIESLIGVVILINALCLFEFYKLFKNTENKINPWFGMLVGTTFLLLGFELEKNVVLLTLIPVIILLVYNLFSQQKNIFGNVGLMMVGLIYFVVPFVILLKGSTFWDSRESFYIMKSYEFALPLLIMVWSNDTFAYLGGKLFGKHKLMPKVSPNKTLEGFVSGLLFASIASYISFYFILENNIAVYYHLIIGVVVGTAATFGDLIQSSVKRMAGVKDSGNILPGHGGIWDRFDGFILAIPAYTATITLISN